MGGLNGSTSRRLGIGTPVALHNEYAMAAEPAAGQQRPRNVGRQYPGQEQNRSEQLTQEHVGGEWKQDRTVQVEY